MEMMVPRDSGIESVSLPLPSTPNTGFLRLVGMWHCLPLIFKGCHFIHSFSVLHVLNFHKNCILHSK